ncbi:MAG TPA: sulfite exporter TauE/SafE family protein, partial [Flavobacterium alvei]|nr:sulfite exporter TauE/SafE family protein [Flavobacterium alvei]
SKNIALSSVVYLNSFLTIAMRNKIQKIIPFVAVIIGIMFIFRGLGLGIPYLSPSNMSLFVQSSPNCH